MGIKNLELREVIKEITRKHLLENNGIAMGQCLTAVGWVGGTLPELYEKDGMVEISMADVAGGGFAVGAALAGKRPMYIIRYQGFNWFNAPIIINYACKSKDIWGRPCPMLIRSIAMEGGIGPVAGSSHHSIYYRMPGIKIYSPMSPSEYKVVYEEFINDDAVYYISEHRGSYSNTDDLNDVVYDKPDYVLFPISITRFTALRVAKRMLDEHDIKVTVHNIFRIKPLLINNNFVTSLKNSRYGACVLDDDYTNGIAKSIAYDLALESSVKIDVLGLKDKTAGFIASKDNLPPSEDEIIELIRSRITKYN